VSNDPSVTKDHVKGPGEQNFWFEVFRIKRKISKQNLCLQAVVLLSLTNDESKLNLLSFLPASVTFRFVQVIWLGISRIECGTPSQIIIPLKLWFSLRRPTKKSG